MPNKERTHSMQGTSPFVLKDTNVTEAEAAVVACLLFDRSLGDECGPLKAEHFRSERLGEAFAGLQGSSEEPCQVLRQQGWMYSEIANLRRWAIAPSLTAYNAERIVEAATTRNLHRSLGESIMEIAGDPLGDAPSVRVARIQEQLTEILPGTVAKSSSLKEVLSSLFREFDEADSTIPTGFPALDDKIQGWPKGTLSIIAARPSVGKSAVCLNAARYLAKDGVPVLYIGFEDRQEQHAKRMLAAESDVPQALLTHSNIRSISSAQMGDIAAAAERLRSLPIYFAEGPLCAREVTALVRQHIRQYGVQAVFVDHIQEIAIEADEKSSNRTYEIQAITQKLRDVAKETDIAVIAACQINRDAEKSERPKVSQLRDSGSLEMIARLILLLYREEDSATMEVIVGKANHGESGGMPAYLGWDGSRCRIW